MRHRITHPTIRCRISWILFIPITSWKGTSKPGHHSTLLPTSIVRGNDHLQFYEIAFFRAYVWVRSGSSLSVCAWLISLNTTPSSSSIQLQMIHFLICMAKEYSTVFDIFFVHSCASGYLGCFYLLASVTAAVRNTLVQMSPVHWLHSLWVYIPLAGFPKHAVVLLLII